MPSQLEGVRPQFLGFYLNFSLFYGERGPVPFDKFVTGLERYSYATVNRVRQKESTCDNLSLPSHYILVLSNIYQKFTFHIMALPVLEFHFIINVTTTFLWIFF